jgi:hypothetical protein
MPLTEKERENWELFRKTHPSGKVNSRKQKIIELSNKGFTTKKIREEVGDQLVEINTVRMWARRKGLW